MPANPNPQRISAAMWDRLIVPCCDLTTTPMKDEQAGVWVRQPGSHADATWLLANRPSDYSLQGVKQRVFTARQGQYGRAWDWGFPPAWSGDWSQIGLYSDRIRVAWETNDPRTYMLFEVLCQTPEDRQPEGFVFYPTKRFRVPDRSHETHMHIGILTVYVDDPIAMADLYSLLSGEPIAAWRVRSNHEESEMQPVLIQMPGGEPVRLVTMGQGHLVMDTVEELADQRKWMRDNNMNDTVWPWPEKFRPLLGPNLELGPVAVDVPALAAAILAGLPSTVVTADDVKAALKAALREGIE